MTTTDGGSRVQGARRRAGLSQRELARRSGVPQPHISAIESGRVHPTPRIVERLLEAARVRPSVLLDRQRSEVLESIAARGGSEPRLFGSIARGEDTPGSDVDLLVSFRPGTTIFDIAGLVTDLEDLLGVEVHVVGDSGRVPSAVLERARAEAVPF